MKKKGIAPEYIYTEIAGTNNMVEMKSILGSKLMDIPNTLTLNSEDIIYYQKSKPRKKYTIKFFISRRKENKSFNIKGYFTTK
jgi:hypothetical protein